ncbi:hypothetical protein SteCoe_14847 [Stentor coeruleus]|uniref:Uncharacterized protein n=1 Tax=Stentor coeruleus TaxID=5963 RepID=A0A1R2C585_9CILI|nr:hypothetical protein SteCoe_14847 [Stentor coeruleus]
MASKVDVFLGLCYKSLVSSVDYGEKIILNVYSSIRAYPPYNLCFFYIFLLLVLWRIYIKFFSNDSVKIVSPQTTSGDIIKAIEQNIKELKGSFTVTKPKVPQVNYNAMSMPRKIDSLYDRVKDIQELHSKFQAEVIDSHIKIFQIINNESDKDYLKLPEPELVEPDSALPPLENNEEFD